MILNKIKHSLFYTKSDTLAKGGKASSLYTTCRDQQLKGSITVSHFSSVRLGVNVLLKIINGSGKIANRLVF